MTRKQLAYTAFVLAFGYVIMFAGVVGYLRHLDTQREQTARAAAAAQEQQREQTRRLVCKLAAGYGDFYRDNPPSPGREGIRDTWAALSAQFACPPS